jgi:hypothetical protein
MADFTETARAGEARERAVREWRDGRDTAIREAYASGMTYEAIGNAVGLTKERIRQICDLRKVNPYAHGRNEPCDHLLACDLRKGEK